MRASRMEAGMDYCGLISGLAVSAGFRKHQNILDRTAQEGKVKNIKAHLPTPMSALNLCRTPTSGAIS
jgi:hypothetical protein